VHNSVTQGLLLRPRVPHTRQNSSDESSARSDSPEPEVDKLIVCKIENEFGYPEEYLDKCLRRGVKNDATTCYHLLLKEDKHEFIRLLTEEK